MLSTVDGKPVNAVPHRADFDALLNRLGTPMADSIREYLDSVIDEMDLDKDGRRTFSSSQLGRELSPWEEPLDTLYHHARVFLGTSATEDEVQDQAALWFGLFVWECIMNRDESWVYWDPNLSATDVNREPMGKVYFEQKDRFPGTPPSVDGPTT